MKKYLFLFVLLLTFGTAEAQVVRDPYMDNVSSNQMTYTDHGWWGEVTYTDATGTEIDFSWEVFGGTLSWNVVVTAASDDILGLHRLLIEDGGSLGTVVDDDFEGAEWGTHIWTSSGSQPLGSSQDNLDVSFENLTNGSLGEYEHFTGTIHYREPI